MSDIVVIGESAFMTDPHVGVGLVAADGGAVLWPLIVSYLKAKEYLLLGQRIPAAPPPSRSASPTGWWPTTTC
jgi:enoyl-CoA hydratase